MSVLWAAAIACVLLAAFCCRVLIIARSGICAYVPNWLGPALFVLMLVVAGLVLVAGSQGAK